MKRLILLGAGHAHVHVLADLAERPIPGWQVLLISPHSRQVYSGMLPGWVAGHYRLEECVIPLEGLTRGSGVQHLKTWAVGLDAERNLVRCADGQERHFDKLSIDTGPVAARYGLGGQLDHALPIRPIEGFVAAWPGLMARIRASANSFKLIIVGAGAAGVELALAIRHRAEREGWRSLRLSLVGAAELPLPGWPSSAQCLALAWLQQQGIEWMGRQRVEVIASDHVRVHGGRALPADEVLLVTGAAAPDWIRDSGLSTDVLGFLRVTPTLQSVSHPSICAAGDVAAYASDRPKSGVFAVRAGAPLARNLRALCQGQAPQAWRPQQQALYLLSGGERRAIACWGGMALGGTWAWRWKDRIDRRFIARFAMRGSTGQTDKEFT